MKPSPYVATATRADMLAKIQAAHDEIEQYFRDIKYWNWQHFGEEIDPDPDGQMAKIQAAYRRTLDHA